MAGYTRQSSFADGDTITALLFNNEYNQLLAAFNNLTGHKHDGTTAEGPVIGLIGDAGLATPLNKILIDSTNDEIEFHIDVSGTSTEQFKITDGAIVPITDNDIDLGTSSLEFKDLYIDGTANIDALAMPTTTVTDILDEDTMSSDSATALATQQSIKAYVDSQVTAQDLDFQADTGGALSIDLDSETFTLTGGTGIDTSGSGNAVTFAIDSTVATLTGSQTLTNKTLTTPVISSISNTGTITLPTSTDTLVGRATTDTLTNKSIDLTDNTLSGTLAEFNTAVSDATLVSTTGSETLTNKTLTSAVLNTGVSGTAVLDEDNMASDSATQLATQQSIKAYVDSQVATANELSELTDTNITSPADGALLFYDTGTSKWIDNVVSGDITIADTGVAAIGTGVIVNADVNSSAAIAYSKLNLSGSILNADINSSAAIDATKIHDGTISNTEFGYLNGVTSAIQTQLDAKAGNSFAVAIAIAL